MSYQSLRATAIGGLACHHPPGLPVSALVQADPSVGISRSFEEIYACEMPMPTLRTGQLAPIATFMPRVALPIAKRRDISEDV